MLEHTVQWKLNSITCGTTLSILLLLNSVSVPQYIKHLFSGDELCRATCQFFLQKLFLFGGYPQAQLFYPLEEAAPKSLSPKNSDYALKIDTTVSYSAAGHMTRHLTAWLVSGGLGVWTRWVSLGTIPSTCSLSLSWHSDISRAGTLSLCSQRP